LLAQGVGNVNAFIRVFEQRLRDNNVQIWNSRVENSSRSTFFKSIVTLNFQFYLKCNLRTTLTAALSRLILSSHNLLLKPVGDNAHPVFHVKIESVLHVHVT